MYRQLVVSAVVPALNEEGAIAQVVTGLLALRHEGESVVDHVVVCDNGSTDKSALRALAVGAQVVYAGVPGYGNACLTAIAALPPSDVVLFVDGDRSCVPEQALRLLHGIADGADLTIGSRVLGTQEAGALTPAQRFGNWLASRLIRLLWGARVSDLGPYRAIRRTALARIAMRDRAFGWTVEMQVKAIQHGLDVREFPVDSLVRIGRSKISGTVRGTVGAARGILGTIFHLRLQQLLRRLPEGEVSPASVPSPQSSGGEG
ncbi:MAG: glycosyltransferase family 2 protein [Pseudomonadota bacterium]